MQQKGSRMHRLLDRIKVPFSFFLWSQLSKLVSSTPHSPNNIFSILNGRPETDPSTGIRPTQSCRNRLVQISGRSKATRLSFSTVISYDRVSLYCRCDDRCQLDRSMAGINKGIDSSCFVSPFSVFLHSVTLFGFITITLLICHIPIHYYSRLDNITRVKIVKLIMQANSLQQKQAYLRSQIIDSGVDPESFMIFMGAAKGEGENINLQIWTLPQLKKVVKQFKDSFQQELKREETQQSKLSGIQASIKNRTSMMVADRVMGSKLSKKQKVFYERDDLWDFQMINKLECRKTHPFFDFKTDPEISCKGVEVKKMGGFLGLGGRYVIELTLAPNFSSSLIIRRSDDADWLHQMLVARYPGSYVPPLTETPTFEPEDKLAISKRAKEIVQFLNNLLQYGFLMQNKYAHMFFTQADPRAFQNYKSKNMGLEPSRNIQSIENLEGFYPLEISQRIQEMIKNSSKFGKQFVPILTNIDENLTKLQNNLASISKYSGHLSQDFGKLREKCITLYQKCSFDKIQQNTEFDRKLAAIFAHLKGVFSSLQVHSKKKSSLIQDFNEQNIKAMIKEWNEFDNLQKKHKRQLDAYLTLKLSLSKRKQQFYLDVSKKQMEERQKTGQGKQTTLAQKEQMYRLKFPADSRLEEERRNWQGYINHMFEKSFLSILNAQEKQLQRKLNKIHPVIAGMLNQRAERYKGFKKYLEEEDSKLGYEHESKNDSK